METRLDHSLAADPRGLKAQGIIRNCVHCGFCNAACPTFRLLGDERDGPRGRIYLIKQLLEGQEVSARTGLHLDRCLLCRACEPACPSGVRYADLLDIGRELVEPRIQRPRAENTYRRLLRWLLPYPARLRPWWRLAQVLRPLLPRGVRARVPIGAPPHLEWPKPRHARRMIILDGCVQSVVAPEINRSAAVILDRLGISLIRVGGSGCCGALSYHLGAKDEGRSFMRRNIDAWLPWIEEGVEAIVVTASGCGASVKDYGDLLADDPVYATRAARIARVTAGLAEIVAREDLVSLQSASRPRVACHVPCTLQHAQGLPDLLPNLLERLGFSLASVSESTLCCGSAGTYSLLQPALAQRLLAQKVAALEGEGPEAIVTDNIGCLMHLRAGASVTVKHWAEFVAEALG